MKTWILVADASKAYVYSTENILGSNFELLHELTHTESREKESELVSGRPGQYHSTGAAQSGYEMPNPKELEADVFAHELVIEMHHGQSNKSFERLIVIAPPHFSGLINKHLKVSPSKVTHIQKDYTKLTKQELIEQIHKHS